MMLMSETVKLRCACHLYNMEIYISILANLWKPNNGQFSGQVKGGKCF